MNGIKIQKPDDWLDRSMIVYASETASKNGVAPNIVITHEVMSEFSQNTVAERIKSFATKQYNEMETNLPSPVFHHQELITVSGHSSAEILVSWQQGRIRLTQWIVMIGRDLERIAICTATAAEADFPKSRDTFSRIIHSIQFDA